MFIRMTMHAFKAGQSLMPLMRYSSPQPDPQRPNLLAPKVKEQHHRDTGDHAGEIESATSQSSSVQCQNHIPNWQKSASIGEQQQRRKRTSSHTSKSVKTSA